MTERVIKVSNQGTIPIPPDIREKFHIKEGDQLLLREVREGIYVILPIESIES